MTALPPVRRVRDGAEIEALCEPHQPLAIFVSSPMNEAAAHVRARCWVVGTPGAELGAVTAVRIRPGLVSASALLLDPEAAPALAAIVRRAGVARLSGGAAHVGPVADLIAGSSGYPLELLQTSWDELPAHRRADDRRHEWRDFARGARAEDVPALVRLYQDFPLEFLDPDDLELAMSALVREHRVVVVEADGEVVGAQRVEARSGRWNLWGGLTIAADHRGKGLSRWIDRCIGERAEIEGRGNAGVRAPTNHVPHDGPAFVTEPWLEVRVPVTPTVTARGKRWARRQVRTHLRPAAGPSAS